MPVEAPRRHDPVFSVGLVGARGHTGRELVALIGDHPDLELTHAWSRGLAGEPVPGAPHVIHAATEPFAVAAAGVDVLILAMPNRASKPYVAAVDAGPRPDTVILDLSADHRFDPAWAYGLPEHDTDDRLAGARRIANPGCYATALQLAVRPVMHRVTTPPHAFGVSGYSGAGTAPSDRNDPELLRDAVIPYALVGHGHEGEVSHHLGRAVRFSPSVAPFFRGIVMTVMLELDAPTTPAALIADLDRIYRHTPLVRVVVARMPRLAPVVGTARADVGGITVGPDGCSAAVVSTIDNLGKGAATQAIQNLNAALDLDPLAGLDPDRTIGAGAEPPIVTTVRSGG